jgi:hypothetical protein
MKSRSLAFSVVGIHILFKSLFAQGNQCELNRQVLDIELTLHAP